MKAARYIGLELAGAKNPKTALAAIEYYPREKKIFLLEIYDRIAAHDTQSSDEALIEILSEEKAAIARMGVNVPLTLPPCIGCQKKFCPLPGQCTVPAVQWMREASLQAARSAQKATRVREFTPYTQRPIELHLRYEIQPSLSPSARFEIDEALGGTKAPLTARLNFLQRHLSDLRIVEISPKLTLALLYQDLGLSHRVIRAYRQIEDGIGARAEILEALSERVGIFIYERDLQKLSRSLAAFDAFLCAFTALLSDLGQCAKIPAGFPAASGWIEIPRLPRGAPDEESP